MLNSLMVCHLQSIGVQHISADHWFDNVFIHLLVFRLWSKPMAFTYSHWPSYKDSAVWIVHICYSFGILLPSLHCCIDAMQPAITQLFAFSLSMWSPALRWNFLRQCPLGRFLCVVMDHGYGLPLRLLDQKADSQDSIASVSAYCHPWVSSLTFLNWRSYRLAEICDGVLNWSDHSGSLWLFCTKCIAFCASR